VIVSRTNILRFLVALLAVASLTAVALHAHGDDSGHHHVCWLCVLLASSAALPMTGCAILLYWRVVGFSSDSETLVLVSDLSDSYSSRAPPFGRAQR
jgi:hypothetical protein